MQIILIPTDFKASGFDCIPALCSQVKGEELKLIFVHVFKLSDSISELLMLSRRNREYAHVSDEFYNNCTQAKRMYPQIKEMKIEFLYGSTVSMFRNFIEANEIDAVLDPADCAVGKINKNSIDAALLIKRSGLPVININKPDVAPVSVSPEEELEEVA
jgi:hypothetical protein